MSRYGQERDDARSSSSEADETPGDTLEEEWCLVDSLMGAGFQINNPNAKSSCACGDSFQ
jgi:hypothetical protein